MTQAQLVTLADQRQAAHQTGGQPKSQAAQSGPSLLGLAAMQ